MGSGASSNVKDIQINQGKGKVDECPGPSGILPLPVVRPPSGCSIKDNADKKKKSGSFRKNTKVENVEILNDGSSTPKLSMESEMMVCQLKQQIDTLESQVANLESEKLDLAEQVVGLEECLESYHQQSVIHQAPQDNSNAIHAKDNYIEKLEQELHSINSQMEKLKLKYKKKLRTANSLLAEAKHHASLKVLEMKDEIARLTEENLKLSDRLNEMQSGLTGAINASADHDKDKEDGRLKIILNLSSQVSEQDSRITDLTYKLREKDRLIQQLQSHLKKRPSSVKGPKSPRSKAGQQSEDKLSDWNELQRAKLLISAVQSPRNRVTGDMKVELSSSARCMSKQNNGGEKDEAEFSEFKSIAQEMKKLQKRKKKDINKIVDVHNVSDYRGSSGISRDSGIISMETDPAQLESTGRATSATSTLSALSGGHDELDLDYCHTSPVEYYKNGKQRLGSATSKTSAISGLSVSDDDEDVLDVKRTIDPSSIRQISAVKKKCKHRESEYEFIDNLLKSENNKESLLNVSDGKPPKYKPAVTSY